LVALASDRKKTGAERSGPFTAAGACPVFARYCPKIPFFGPAADIARGLFFAPGGWQWGDQRMTNQASGRQALLLAAGLFVCLAGPSQAAAGAEDAAAAAPSQTAGTPVALHKYARHGSHHWKKYAHRRSGKVALNASSGNKTADAADDGDRSSAIPPSVANANAQMTSAQTTSADTPTSNATKAMAARANDILQAAPDKPADAASTADAQTDGKVVAADQLNDVDRALRESAPPESTPPAAPLALASAEAEAAPAAPVAAGNQSTAWDETSLIGKIFIGFGALLTMASAARMFMA